MNNILNEFIVIDAQVKSLKGFLCVWIFYFIFLCEHTLTVKADDGPSWVEFRTQLEH